MRMTSISSLMSLVLLVMMMMMSISVVQSGPRNIVRREVSDSTHLNDDTLTDCFASLSLGNQCDNSKLPPATDKEGCECVPHSNCQDAKTTAGNKTLINLRSTCKDTGETCCVNVAIPPNQTPPPSHTQKCGQLNLVGVGENTFIGLEGNKAQFGQYPWMAMVRTNQVYVCGGSLIHPKVVLTTAHNIEGKVAQDLLVRLGDWDLKSTTEHIEHQNIKVESIVRHPLYVLKGNQLEYDVAVLVLESQAVLGPTVDTICLPDPSDTFDEISCFTSGWGKDAFGKAGKFQEVLKSLRLPVVSHSQCQDALRRTGLGSSYILHKSFICAGGEGGVDTCEGDGGSPLVCPMKNDHQSYVQAGMVAWGIECGKEGLPGVYASISEVVDWIRGQIPLDTRRGNKK